jgi:hypothetical protein
MSAGFTPGPWRQSVDRGIEQTTIVSAGGLLIGSARWDEYGRWKANARLIAAAPDLLLALVWLHSLNALPPSDAAEQMPLAILAAEAAIATATGAAQ